MKKIISLLSVLLITIAAFSQPLEVQIFQKEAIGSTVKVGFRARSTGANFDYLGVSFLIYYQSTGIAPLSTAQNSAGGIDDSRLVTTYQWGTSARNTNPSLPISRNPSGPGSPVYDRAYIYGNVDETVGSHIQTLTNQWDTLIYITFNTLLPTYPQGGYIYHPGTAAQATVGFVEPIDFATIPFSVTVLDLPLGESAVPVLFSQFDAKCNDLGTLLTWTTAQESNSNYFEIEKSNNGSTWAPLTRVNAAGNSTIIKNYQYTDAAGGTAFYRIKQVDNDGAVFYTSIEATNCDSKTITNVIYPVPAKDVLYVSIKSDKALKTKLQVYDAAGKIVRSIEAVVNKGSNTFNMNLKGLASGDYIIRSTDNEINLKKRFVISN